MKPTAPDWHLVIDFINKTLEDAARIVDGINVEAVRHYVRHGEYEMAFEILFLEIMRFPKLEAVDCTKALKLAVLLKLNTFSVYDDSFFEKLTTYCFLDA